MIVGHDNAVHSVKLKRSDGQVVHHSINHLYPLELSITHAYHDNVEDRDETLSTGDDESPSPVVEDHNIDSGSSAAGEGIVETPSVRPKRQAATA